MMYRGFTFGRVSIPQTRPCSCLGGRNDELSLFNNRLSCQLLLNGKALSRDDQ